MTMFGVINESFTGRSNSGAFSVTGLKVGDIVIWSTAGGTWQQPGAVFERIVSVDDEIQQEDGAGDLSSSTCQIIALRMS